MRTAQFRFRPTGLIVLTASLAASCTANKQPSKVETALANMAKDVAIPIEAETLANPLPANDDVVSQGRQVYSQSCAVCHGPDGRGSTDLGRNMYPPAMDLSSPHVQHWRDAELFWIIQNGVRLTGMPSWKPVLSENDTWALVEFLRGLPNDAMATGADTAAAGSGRGPEAKEETIAYGRTLYRQEGCFACHRLDGEGVDVGPDLTVEGTRGRKDAWLVGHFKEPAKFTPGSIMPSFVNLTDDQLAALAAFLQTQKGSEQKQPQK